MVDLQDRISTQGVALFLAFALAASAAAADETKRYPLPDNSSLELKVPAGWQDEVKPKEGSNPASIAFTAKQGAAFNVLVTPIGLAKPGPATDAQIRATVQQAADKIKPQVAEPILYVDEFKGGNGPGYYFSATDAAPKPEEFKFLSQGILLVGEVVVSFGVLTNDGQEQVKEQAFSMMRSASHIKP